MSTERVNLAAKGHDMDEYGIGSAAAMGLQLYELASRASGRTSRMLDAARDDDLIICRTTKETDRIRRLLKEKGKATRVTTIQHRDELSRIGPRAKGRALFDHDWVHHFFVEAVKGAEEDLRRLADTFSSVPLNRTDEQRQPMNMQRRRDFPF